ncbi:MAG: M14 family metallopeptidase [Prolixibacteraceae bacterium]|nr:M14 family metallopeptidase [Prolixibacteraceae bacterium]
MRNIILFLVLASLALTGYPEDNYKIEVPLRFDRYYDYSEVVAALKALHDSFPEMTTLDIVGKSEENREIYALTINNPETGEALNKPGVYIDGNIHGNEVQAGEVCLYYANMLLTKYNENEIIKKAVDRNVHYIIPVVNVDGRYHFFNAAHTPSSSRSIRVPVDDDRDGLFDEDPPDDLDGDGNICQMRIKDPFGQYKPDPEDQRIMVRVKPGEKGEYSLLGYEGIDNDNDGRLNEDAEGYLDPNRNWGHNWLPPYAQRGSGKFPLSGTGLKSIEKYIMERPNIIIGFAFHNSGGMWLRVPAEKSVRMYPSDVAAYDVIGKEAVKITPGYVYQPSYDLYPTYGDFDSHLYFVHGALSFCGELFVREHETYREKSQKTQPQQTNSSGTSVNDRNRELLKFNDNLTQGELYKEWTKFDHPLYGEIEIGGWVKMSSRLPHPFMLPELVHRNSSVVLLSASQTPEIEMDVFEVKKMSGNLNRVRVRLQNKNGLPSMTAYAYHKNLYSKDFLKVNGGDVIAGGKITDLRHDKVNYKKYKPEIQFFAVAGYEVVEYQFLIEGKGDVTFTFKSLKAKDKTVKIEL